MKLLYCNNCQDVFRLYKTTSTCLCSDSGGHYKTDGLNAIYYGPAVPLGFTNTSFVDAIRNQPEWGKGEPFTAFVIPKVCPTMELVDLSDYIEVYEDGLQLSEVDEDELMERAALDRNIKKTKIKNVFKNED